MSEKSRKQLQYREVVTYYFPDIEISIQQRKPVSFHNFQITDIFGDILFIFYRPQDMKIFLGGAASFYRTQE